MERCLNRQEVSPRRGRAQQILEVAWWPTDGNIGRADSTDERTMSLWDTLTRSVQIRGTKKKRLLLFRPHNSQLSPQHVAPASQRQQTTTLALEIVTFPGLV